MDWVVGCVSLIHLIVAPFTKVEESFNLQACHDLLFNGVELSQYDHLEFAGAVPRTFVGPIVVSVIAYPAVTIIRLLGLSKFIAQYIVRGVLGLLVILAWRKFRKQLLESFGPSVTFWFTLITASQFHFMYYLSRPLPNTFALVLALLAFSYWLEQRHCLLIWTCGIAVLIFRSELCLLLGPMVLADLATRRLQIVPFLRYAIPAGFTCLATTITVDSLFWGRLLWPEGEVFWFNTYKNQSHNWGTLPFLWYWYSALPRALGFSLFLVPFGMARDRRIQVLMYPALIFIGCYSFLPHKELRFIIYVFPIFNAAAARACHILWEGREKSSVRQLLAIGSALHLMGNVALTALLLTISARNYPGGHAMYKLHQVVPQDAHANVHIDNYAAQTGVSRFTQLHDHWKYNKTEKLKAGCQDLRRFTHLLVEGKSKFSYSLKQYSSSHAILSSVEAFYHLDFNYHQFPPVKVRVKPAIFILKNLVEEDIDWSWLPQEAEDTLPDEIQEEDVPKMQNVDSQKEREEEMEKVEDEVEDDKQTETENTTTETSNILAESSEGAKEHANNVIVESSIEESENFEEVEQLQSRDVVEDAELVEESENTEDKDIVDEMQSEEPLIEIKETVEEEITNEIGSDEVVDEKSEMVNEVDDHSDIEEQLNENVEKFNDNREELTDDTESTATEELVQDDVENKENDIIGEATDMEGEEDPQSLLEEPILPDGGCFAPKDEGELHIECEEQKETEFFDDRIEEPLDEEGSPTIADEGTVSNICLDCSDKQNDIDVNQNENENDLEIDLNEKGENMEFIQDENDLEFIQNENDENDMEFIQNENDEVATEKDDLIFEENVGGEMQPEGAEEEQNSKVEVTLNLGDAETEVEEEEIHGNLAEWRSFDNIVTQTRQVLWNIFICAALFYIAFSLF